MVIEVVREGGIEKVSRRARGRKLENKGWYRLVEGDGGKLQKRVFIESDRGGRRAEYIVESNRGRLQKKF
jgi:hypothetical protein